MDKALLSDIYRRMHKGDLEGVRQLLMAHPESISQQFGRKTWLHHASSFNNIQMMAMLLDLGLDVNAPAEMSPEGPLYEAVIEESVESVHWLLEHGAQINVPVGGEIRVAALADACHQGNLEMVQVLVKHGAEAPFRDSQVPRSTACEVRYCICTSCS